MLGDNIVYLPVVQELCSQFGRSSVTILTTPSASALYHGLLDSENIIVIDHAVLRRLYQYPVDLVRLVNRFRKERFDLCFIPYDQGTIARFIGFLSGAKKTVAADNPKAHLLFLADIRLQTDLSSPMALQDWALLNTGLNHSLGGALSDFQDLPPAPDLSHLIKGDKHVVPGRIMIHPGASREYKKWPIDRFANLANLLVTEGKEVFWCNQDGDEGLLDSRVMRLPLGQLSEFIEKLSSCSLFVGNNSGPMNLANALAVPLVVFSGPSPHKWDPFWNKNEVTNLRVEELDCQPCDKIYGAVNSCSNTAEPMACMTRISVDYVFEICMKKLSESRSC